MLLFCGPENPFGGFDTRVFLVRPETCIVTRNILNRVTSLRGGFREIHFPGTEVDTARKAFNWHELE
jgi:hypothetical protein